MPATGKFDIIVSMEKKPTIYLRKLQCFFKLNYILSPRLPIVWVSVKTLLLTQTASLAAGSLSYPVPNCFVHQWH